MSSCYDHVLQFLQSACCSYRGYLPCYSRSLSGCGNQKMHLLTWNWSYEPPCGYWEKSLSHRQEQRLK
ncbi:hypothetical protein LEMLEM_LOCUS23573 [Lemmus lemmus]